MWRKVAHSLVPLSEKSVIEFWRSIVDLNWILENYHNSMTVSNYVKLQNFVKNELSRRISRQWEL